MRSAAVAAHTVATAQLAARPASALTRIASALLILVCALTVLGPLSSSSAQTSLLPGVEASNICICECCDGTNCLRDWNSTFAIGSCSDCTKDLCTTTYTACSQVPDVNAKCINRDSIWNKATILIFLITLGALIVLGCARNQSPYLQKLISTGNTAH